MFSGSKTTAETQLPNSNEPINPIHMVQLIGNALDRNWQRIQLDTTGTTVARVICSAEFAGSSTPVDDVLTNKQRTKLMVALTDDKCAQVEAGDLWRLSRCVVNAYQHST